MGQITFQYVKPTEEQIAKMQKFRDAFEALAETLESELESSRGKSLALTKLEEASFWVNKAITHNS